MRNSYVLKAWHILYIKMFLGILCILLYGCTQTLVHTNTYTIVLCVVYKRFINIYIFYHIKFIYIFMYIIHIQKAGSMKHKQWTRNKWSNVYVNNPCGLQRSTLNVLFHRHPYTAAKCLCPSKQFFAFKTCS